MLTKLAQEFTQQTNQNPAASEAEVKKVCTLLGLSDWSTYNKKTDIPQDEARKILAAVAPKGTKVPIKEFRRGLKVELEHGRDTSGINLTNNHPIYTAQIALAHLKESFQYYVALEKMEESLEGNE